MDLLVWKWCLRFHQRRNDTSPTSFLHPELRNFHHSKSGWWNILFRSDSVDPLLLFFNFRKTFIWFLLFSGLENNWKSTRISEIHWTNRWITSVFRSRKSAHSYFNSYVRWYHKTQYQNLFKSLSVERVTDNSQSYSQLILNYPLIFSSTKS